MKLRGLKNVSGVRKGCRKTSDFQTRESLGFFRSCRYFMRKFPLQKQTKKRKVCQVQVHAPHFDRVSFMKSHQSQQAVRIGAVPAKLSTFGCCVGTVEGSCLLADESHNHHHQTQSKQIIQPANTLRSPNIMFRDHLGVGAGG